MGNNLEIKSFLLKSRNYTIFGLICIAIGLSLSKPLISLGYIFLALSWIIDGNFSLKLKHFFTNKAAVVLVGIYSISILGLIHTSNFEYGLDDVRRKIFLFALPFLLSGLKPLSSKEIQLLLKTFIIGVLAATLWSFFVYLGGLNIEINDARDYSRFDSHIRFGLEITLAIFFSLYYGHKSNQLKNKFLWFTCSLWLLIILLLLKLFTGTVVLISTALILLLVFGFLSPIKKIKYLFLSIFSLAIIVVSWFAIYNINDFNKAKNVVPIKEIEFTKYGERYQKNEYTNKSTLKENGYYVERNIAWTEFRETWNKRSKIDFNGKNLKGNLIRHTLARFITSKGQRKDRESVEKLTKEEIKAIEKGVPNVKYLHMNFLSVRIHKILWEFHNYYNGGDFNGHSVVMRWVYWKTAFQIFKNNLWFGVGTGDLQDAFNKAYKESNTILKPKYWLRAHNQYITYFVSHGIFGGFMFLMFLFYPLIKSKMFKNYLYLSFFAVISLSMLTEDTLETQVGINLFIFFNSIFLINKPK